ncbi:hypothetical protein PAPYR_8928 [Paratrimastix pyriformis]|uniref:Uncharacterized protein n=1 Tax=Paratrimastix pyriformis TaxID=342808 RepID=A0ABQ8UEC1_9EUKA|nr:hypothetical protein PAPYR_8928 [Paratrimastix pyriformis]
MTFYQYPNNAAIGRFYSELAAHQSPPVRPEPISFGNVFFNTIDVSSTLATMTAQERAVANETARYYTAHHSQIPHHYTAHHSQILHSRIPSSPVVTRSALRKKYFLDHLPVFSFRHPG